MTDIMMMLGGYVFSVNSAAYSQFKRQTSWIWTAQTRLNRDAALQYTSKGTDAIELSGQILPHYKGGLNQLEAMRHIADRAQPLLLVDGLGHIMGKWVILKIEETQTHFTQNGLPLKIDFNLSLKHYGE